MAVQKRASQASIFFQIPMTVWAVGLVSLLVNGSSVIIFSLFPLYATSVLGVSYVGLGVIEAIVEAIAWFTRVFSGVVSDFLHKRKPLLLGAYAIGALSRFVFPIAPTINWLVGARAIDRIANGLQASPREALVGDVAPHDLKGACYGLRQTLSLIGSFVGSVMLMYLFHQLGVDYQLAFWLAIIPSFLAVVILVFFVKDRTELKERRSIKLKPFHLHEILNLPKSYWFTTGIAAFFMISNYSGAFMILQTKKAGLTEADIPIVMIIQNLAAFLSAFPIGWLSDKLGRVTFLSFGFILVIISNLFLATTDSLFFVLIGVAIWGIQMGINQSLLVAKIADSAPYHLRGSAFGIYYLMVGAALFLSNTVSGWLSHTYGSESVFYASSVIAAFALIALPLTRRAKKTEIKH